MVGLKLPLMSQFNHAELNVRSDPNQWKVAELDGAKILLFKNKGIYFESSKIKMALFFGINNSRISKKI